MTIAPGQRLGSYEITAKLGEGGMGEVYRATDTKLKRDVAIKVLPAAFTEDKERLARFEREAQLLAQLHHPNIASIFGLEDADGTRALVMELVEGPTLAERLEGGALPLDESLSLARQIAEALEEAHDKGIIHRDLKPQNIKASREGKVKVLDFGLAKAMDPAGAASGAGSASQLAASPTLTLGATQMGVILGTAAYMSPEQAKGLAVDKRADIWAFGVVLFEMLTGRRLFEGDSVPETLAGVLKTEIDLAKLPDDTPPAIRRLLRRCLERHPKNRLHDIADARIVIDEVLSGKSDELATQGGLPETAAMPSPRRVLAFVGAALAFGAVGGWLLHRPAAAPPAPASRWALALPEEFTLSTDDFPHLALSRDGRLQVAAVVGKRGVQQLLLRRSDEFEPKLLEGTEGATSPFFSPDGAWIGFFRDDALMKIPSGGGPPVRLASAFNGGRGGTWSTDGFIYLASDFATSLSRVSENGGEIQAVTKLDGARSERTHRWPEALPDGDAVLFTCDTLASTEYYDDARIEAVRPATGERKVLVEGASQARYAPGGHLVFARGGALFAVAFDPKTLAVRGSPRQVVQGVSTNVGSGAVQFALAQNGAALWAPGGLSSAYRIVWVDRHGVESPVDIPQATYNELGLSPDGSRLALIGGQGGASDLWVADLRRGALTRLTTGIFARGPVWTPDGTRIAYAVVQPGAGENRGRIDWRPADGSRDAEILVAEGQASFPSGFTPDGRELLFDQTDNTVSLSNVWALPLAGERRPRPVDRGNVRALRRARFAGRQVARLRLDRGGSAERLCSAVSEGRRQVADLAPARRRAALEPGRARALLPRRLGALPGGDRHRARLQRGTPGGRSSIASLRAARSSRTAISADGTRFLTLRTAEGSGAQRTLDLDLGFARRLDAPASDRR